MFLFYKMPELEKQPIKRQVAYKVRIKDILNSRYVKEDGWQPNYIEVNGNKVSRVNLIGTVVLKIDKDNALLDDGSGKISLRVFENNRFFEKIDIGDVILLIGRPREFGSEKYIMPEILKKVNDTMWINVRKTELALNNKNSVENPKEEKKEEVMKKVAVEEVEDENTSEKIFNFIKKSDRGEGVDMAEILDNIDNRDAEKMINKLLENGEIFEITPGKFKVLE